MTLKIKTKNRIINLKYSPEQIKDIADPNCKKPGCYGRGIVGWICNPHKKEEEKDKRYPVLCSCVKQWLKSHRNKDDIKNAKVKLVDV